MASVNDRIVRTHDDSTHVIGEPVASVDAKEVIKRDLHYLLVEEMEAELAAGDGDLALRRRLEQKLNRVLEHEVSPLSAVDADEIVGDVIDGLLGYGPIAALLDDPTVSEVMVNGPREIYVERAGRISLTDKGFVDSAHLGRVVDRIAASAGRRVDEDSPTADIRLPDGTQIHIVAPPLAINGPVLTIRKYTYDPFTAEDLIAFGTMSARLDEFIAACVRGRLNVLISGRVRSGKTTLLNVASSYIPADERIITAEDAAELRLKQDHVLRLESRPPGIGGEGEVSLRDVVRNSLRMRPDRIIVGEVSGAEVVELVQAMNAGHDGSMFTVHADSPITAVERLETMMLMAGIDYPSRIIRDQISSALDVIIHMERLRDGTRRVVQVCEVAGVKGESVELREIFALDLSSGVDDDGRFQGRLAATGRTPAFVQRLESMGVAVPTGTFDAESSEG